MNKDSYMVKRHKHRCGRLGLITNTLLASAGAGTVAFLVTAMVFQADGVSDGLYCRLYGCGYQSAVAVGQRIKWA